MINLILNNVSAFSMGHIVVSIQYKSDINQRSDQPLSFIGLRLMTWPLMLLHWKSLLIWTTEVSMNMTV